MSDSDKMTDPGGYVDQALDALGGGDSDFLVAADVVAGNVALRLSCRLDGCEWGYTVGEMELWELAADARDHFEKSHGVAAPVKAGETQ